MLADAWATALTVLGVNEHAWVGGAGTGFGGIFDSTGWRGFSSRYTDAFAPYLGRAPSNNSKQVLAEITLCPCF